MRVLVIEDDQLTVRSLELLLYSAGISNDAAGTGEGGIALARLHDYAAILLDLDLPDLHGNEVLRRLRDMQLATPVIILTGDGETATKVTGFGCGADDFITKPFHSAELIARLHALVRRSRGYTEAVITAGPITVDLTARTVSVADRRVPLTGKEFAVMELLALNKGTTLSREMFLKQLYGAEGAPEVKLIDVFVCKLRKKLDGTGPGAARCLETVWGRGYALHDPQVRQTVQVA